MKAILEMEMPISCRACRLVAHVPAPLCLIINRGVRDYREDRHPNCPLKIAEEARNETGDNA